MALVVLLRGVNVGGHRTFRPSTLAARLKHLDVVSIGAAGTFVVRQPVTQAQLRIELARHLPGNVPIAICRARDIVQLTSRDFYSGCVASRDIVRFVSVLTRSPRSSAPLPMDLPATGTWLVRILAQENRFVVGLYRRQMKVIGCLGALDRLFGVPVTTRSWSTIVAIARALDRGTGRSRVTPRT